MVALCGIHIFPSSLLRRLNVYRSDFSKLYSRTYLTVKPYSPYWIPKTVEDNRQSLCLKLFNKVKTQPSSKLSHLVPCTRYESHGRLLRGGNNSSLYKCRTGRYRNSFFPTMTEVYNQCSSILINS